MTHELVIQWYIFPQLPGAADLIKVRDGWVDFIPSLPTDTHMELPSPQLHPHEHPAGCSKKWQQ